jgi:hypothetical protein
VHDLLGTSQHPADALPDDATVDGFDTVGDGLNLTMAHLEPLEQAATQLVEELYALPQTDARRTAVLVCQLKQGSESDCMRQILTGFARRAFRRTVAEAEVTRMLALGDKIRSAGGTYDDALKGALTSILISPHFLYMVEKKAGAGVSPVSNHELATRLSYFLWSSMPDAALFAAADAGTLSTDNSKLLEQAERMLKDTTRANALRDNFSGQWLTLRRLALFAPDPKTFPTYVPTLRDAAVQETESFFGALISDNLPVQTLFTANFSFVNQELGKHYGITATGTNFQRVDLSSTPRVGLLTQASFLMMNAHPAFTSPTKRGAWVLEQLLCAPPPPVPPDLAIGELTAPAAGETTRQKLERHRAEEPCKSCHSVMDPIGLGLENFDAIGAYRTMENGVPIDARGNLLGTDFTGAKELAQLLAPDTRLQSCFTQQLLTYSVGRTFSKPDGRSYADALAKHSVAAGRAGVHDLIAAVVQSEAFRTRRGE